MCASHAALQRRTTIFTPTTLSKRQRAICMPVQDCSAGGKDSLGTGITPQVFGWRVRSRQLFVRIAPAAPTWQGKKLQASVDNSIGNVSCRAHVLQRLDEVLEEICTSQVSKGEHPAHSLNSTYSSRERGASRGKKN